ncbi:hypothetical protein [Thiomicrospira sp.]|uniref:hypothetical protein n=1 Tax=Thiomicrospira sp. TaxID=935 RepID=UPI002F95C922
MKAKIGRETFQDYGPHVCRDHGYDRDEHVSVTRVLNAGRVHDEWSEPLNFPLCARR